MAWSLPICTGVHYTRAIGDREVGGSAPQADLVVLQGKAGQHAMRWRQSLVSPEDGPETIDQAAQLRLGIMTVGDDRNVDETWAAGRRVYSKRQGAVRG